MKLFLARLVFFPTFFLLVCWIMGRMNVWFGPMSQLGTFFKCLIGGGAMIFITVMALWKEYCDEHGIK